MAGFINSSRAEILEQSKIWLHFQLQWDECITVGAGRLGGSDRANLFLLLAIKRTSIPGFDAGDHILGSAIGDRQQECDLTGR